MSHNSGIPKIIVDEALRQHKKLSEMKTFRGCNRWYYCCFVYVAGKFIIILEQQNSNYFPPR